LTKPLRICAIHREDPVKPRKPLLEALRSAAAVLIPVISFVALQRITVEQPLRPGDRAPALTLRTASSGTTSLASPYTQRLAILFFSADCSRCRGELENLQRLQLLFAGRIEFLLITRSDRERTIALLDSLKVGITVGFDENSSAHAAFGVFKVPALFLVNSNGIVQLSSFGEHSLAIRKDQLESLLGQRSTESPKPTGSPE
jgi:peroxiredoxin